MQISFMGYKVLNWYERFAWPPVLLAFVVALGVGGKHLYNVPAANPATAQQVLNFASVLAGFVITYSAMASDFTMYYKPTVSRCASILGTVHAVLGLFFFPSPSHRIFWYSYLSYVVPIVRAFPCTRGV